MRTLLITAGLALIAGGCCCRSPQPAAQTSKPAVEQAAAAPVATVATDYFIGDLVLARLERRSQAGMDRARAAVVATVRTAVGGEAELRAWWSVLHVSAATALQAKVGQALRSLRMAAGGEGDVVVATHDVAAILKTLPVITAMGPGTEEAIPKEATLFEALYFELGLAEGAPGPGLRIHRGTLTVDAPAAKQAGVAAALRGML